MTFFSKKSHAALGLDHQVQWQHPKVISGEIDQTRLAIANSPTEAESFSFLVMGDTDAGTLATADVNSFADAFPQQLLQQLGDSRFLLHTGDVTYPTGSYQNYLEGFLRPYRSLLSHLPDSPAYSSDDVVFNRPLLPVLGNHDYASLPRGFWGWQSVRRKIVHAVCDRLRQMGLDCGHYGGEGGEAYGQTFLDDLAQLSSDQLTTHLANHYSVQMPQSSSCPSSYCLNYQPSQFTRLPNRYYCFRYGGVDFFALDSNTWNKDDRTADFDSEQLAWLEKNLVASYQTPDTVGRIIYLHHSPYTTEESRWQKPETLWVRRHLRSLLDRVAAAVKPPGARQENSQKPLVDLVISGHAHCLEHVQTTQTGHADANMDWIVCGGSGASLRRQRKAGVDILERITNAGRSHTDIVAKSRLYVSAQSMSAQDISTQGRRYQQSAHSFLKIDVRPGQQQPFVVRPCTVVRQADSWQTQELSPLVIQKGVASRTTSIASGEYAVRKAS